MRKLLFSFSFFYQKCFEKLFLNKIQKMAKIYRLLILGLSIINMKTNEFIFDIEIVHLNIYFTDIPMIIESLLCGCMFCLDH